MTSRHNKKNRKRTAERRFTVRGVRRNPPDVGKLAKALIALAAAEAEREAQAERIARTSETQVDSDTDTNEGGEPNA